MSPGTRPRQTGGPGIPSRAVGPGLTRRAVLVRGLSVGVAAGGAGALIAACGSTAAASGLQSRREIPGPQNPKTWPIHASNQPIASGLRAERNASLQVFCRADHVSPQVLSDFARAYRCQVGLTSFATDDAALRTLRQRGDFDVVLGVPANVLAALVPPALLRPLNHSYLPNLAGVWPKLADPYYDVHSRYTIPYTVYSTGIAWRRDQVTENPYATANGWAFPWQAAYASRVGILDDYREAIGLGLIYIGVTDLNTADPRLLEDATRALEKLARLTRARAIRSVSADLAAGRVWIQQAQSGQAAAALSRLPRGVPAEAIGYWFPPDGVGPVGSDLGAVPRGGQNPVLAHLFLNFLLNHDTAVVNMRRIGYMQPLNWLTPDRLVRHGALPQSLLSAAILPTFLDHGLKELELLTPSDTLWHSAWRTLQRRL
ncbi:MAG: extracellular solute-binding protein [Streptosporangiaceae bacterium]